MPAEICVDYQNPQGWQSDGSQMAVSFYPYVHVASEPFHDSTCLLKDRPRRKINN